MKVERENIISTRGNLGRKSNGKPGLGTRNREVGGLESVNKASEEECEDRG